MIETLVEILTYWPPVTAGFAVVAILFPRMTRVERRIQR